VKLRKVAVSLTGPLKEWVSLECEGDKPPRVRTARPLSGLQHEGTRKRRRAAMGDYAWSVGDRVDAWIQERYPLWPLLQYTITLVFICKIYYHHWSFLT
jgi:hypothetical protein